MAVQRGSDGQFSEMRIYRLTPEEPEGAAAPTKGNATVGVSASAKASASAAVGAVAKAGTLSPRPKMRVERAREEENAGRRYTARSARRSSDFSLRDWRAWAAVGFVLAWCAAFYIWQKPQSPWAFDRPEAQTRVKEHIPLPR